MHIYKITNKINNKVYIGQTVQKNPKIRWYAHCDYMHKGRKSYLYDSVRKYGIENFLWKVIDAANNINKLNEKEQAWLEHYQKIAVVYNNREAGGNKLHNPKSIEKMRESQRKAHARRRALGTDTRTRRDGGAMKGKAHTGRGIKGRWSMPDCAKEKIRQIQLERSGTRGKTWKIVDGKRIYMEKE